MNLNPSNWSAKAQALAVALVPVLVALLDHFLKWNIDAKTILGLLGLGGLGAVSVAHIDNGEPAGPDAPPVTATGLTEAEKATVKSLTPPVLWPKLGLVLLVGLALSACQTGAGRAVSLAVSGVPPTVPQALDGIEAEYDLRAKFEMDQITTSTPGTDAGLVAQAKAQTALQARIDDEHALIDAVRTYVGVVKGASPTATTDAAEKTKTAALDAILAKIAKAKLEKAAAVAKPPTAEGK